MKILSLTTIVATLMTSVLARSSVYMISSTEQLETKPEVSLNAFSMFYSHMLDTTHSHPALRLQNVAQKEAIEGVQKITPFLPQSNDIFTKQVNANMMVIVSGVQSPQDILSTHDTSFFVSDDESKSYSTLAQDTFKQMDSDDITTTIYKNSEKTVKEGGEEVVLASTLTLEESFDSFKNDFANLNTDVFDMNNDADALFVNEVEDVRAMFSGESKQETVDMRVIEISSLETLAQEYGVESKQYKEAHLVLRDLFEKFVIPNFQQLYNNGAISTFVLTPVVKQQNERRDFQLNRLVAPVQDTCFKTMAACKNATDNCSGNGQCTQLEVHCFSCECKTSSHFGESCQYVDAVSDFQLLFWTGVLLFVITTSVVVCVYQSGDIVDGGIIMAQSLPKQD